MAAPAPKVDAYPFTRQFEITVAFAEATTPRFHDTIGHALDSDRFFSADAQALVRAAQNIALETGVGCGSAMVALQHIRRQCDAGRVTFETLRAATELVELAQDLGGVVDLDQLVSEVTPVIKRIAQQEAVRGAIGDYSSGADSAAAVERFEKVAALGSRRGTLGQALPCTAEDIAATVKYSVRDPLPTGIPDLDTQMGGGLERGSMGVVVGGPGGGKSLFLTHVAVEALLLGYDVAFLTLELQEWQIKQRIYCNLADMTKEELDTDPAKASARCKAFEKEGLGRLVVRYETPLTTSPMFIRPWFRDLERERGLNPVVLIIDYADNLIAGTPGAAKRSAYEEMRMVYEFSRTIMVERDGWLWTASQMTRAGLHKKKADLDSIADSISKARVADCVLTIPRTEEDEAQGMIRIRNPKRRNEAAHFEVGPLPMDAAHGRLVALARTIPW